MTCRDWFQLSLKEGLTVFREQEVCGFALPTVVVLLMPDDVSGVCMCGMHALGASEACYTF